MLLNREVFFQEFEKMMYAEEFYKKFKLLNEIVEPTINS